MAEGDAEYFYEREAEYYGFTPFQLLDRVGEAVVSAVFATFARVEESLGRLSFLSPGQAAAGLAQWTALVEARFGRNYELFEAYIVRNVLCLPDAFVAPHHRRALEPRPAGVDLDRVSALLAQKRALLAEAARLDAIEQRTTAAEVSAAALETAVAAMRERLAAYGAFEHTAAELADHVRTLQAIAAGTLAGARALAASADEGPFADCGHVGADAPSLDAELASCLRIATLPDLKHAVASLSPAC